MNGITLPGKVVLLEKYERLIFKAGRLLLRCEYGKCWVTWPWSGDVFLDKGEEINIRARGIISITSVGEDTCRIEVVDAARKCRPEYRSVKPAVKTGSRIGSGILNTN